MKTVVAIGRIENGEFVDVILADQALLSELPERLIDPLDRFSDEGRDPYMEEND